MTKEQSNEIIAQAFKVNMKDRLKQWVGKRKCLICYDVCTMTDEFNYTAKLLGKQEHDCCHFWLLNSCLLCGGICSIHSEVVELHMDYAASFNLPPDPPGLCFGAPFQEIRRLMVDHKARIDLITRFGIPHNNYHI
jgi:hypothetical protein